MRPSQCNVFTTLSEKTVSIFVIGAKYILNKLPFYVFLNEGMEKKLERHKIIVLHQLYLSSESVYYPIFLKIGLRAAF